MRKVTELEIRRLALGLDRPEMAVQLELCCEEGGGINARTLRRWEARTNKPFRLFRKALCKYFNVGSVAQLGLGTTFEAARWRTWMTPDEWTAEVDRRQMLGLAASGTVVLLLPVPELVAAAQFLEGRRRIGAGDLATATRVATDIAVAYADTPDADVVRAAKTQVYTLLDLLDRATMSSGTNTQLRAVASDAASLAGYADLQGGRLDKAERWFAKALELARQAGDRRLEALALASSACIPLAAPQPDRTLVLEAFEAAAAFQRFLPPAERAWLFSYLGRERAAVGDALSSGRFLEQARTAAARIQGDDPGWGLWSTHGTLPMRPELCLATRSLLLNRPTEAIEIFDAELDGTTAPIGRANLHRRVMQACVALGDPDRACASAHTTLDEAKKYGLGLWPKEIRKVRMTFRKQWSTLRPVIELDERLALAG
ncbi:MAG: hypothetical protein ACRDYX_14875 [Egibacteraceae bacterium]